MAATKGPNQQRIHTMSDNQPKNPPIANAPEPERKKSRIRKIGSGVGRLTRPKQRFQMPNGRSGLKVVIATDAWKPQVNGVVRTLDTLGQILTGFGNHVIYISPNEFKSVPLPSYPEIRLSLLPNRKVAKMMNEFKPDAIHIATEGPIMFYGMRHLILQRPPAIKRPDRSLLVLASISAYFLAMVQTHPCAQGAFRPDKEPD